MASFDICEELPSDLSNPTLFFYLWYHQYYSPKIQLAADIACQKCFLIFLLLVIVHNCAKSNLLTTLGDNITMGNKATIYNSICSNISIAAQLETFPKIRRGIISKKWYLVLSLFFCLIIGKGDTLEIISFRNWVFNIGFLLICWGLGGNQFSIKQSADYVANIF